MLLHSEDPTSKSISRKATAFVVRFLAVSAVGSVLAMSGCSSDTSPAGADSGTGGSSSGGSANGGKDAGGTCAGGPVSGTNPDHCTSDAGVAIKQAATSCLSDAGADDTESADAAASDYGATMVGTEGDDDDCKYHVKYSVAPICENEGATFTVTVTRKTDGTPVTGAYPSIEATLGDTAIALGGNNYVEKPGGVYTVGPVTFKQSGKWTVRFHFFENCSDAPEDSEHGHAAFYVNVP